MGNPFRVVLVGCGGISGTWLGPVTAMPDLQVVGLVDRVEENARQRAADFRLESAVVGTDLRAVLKKTRPDVVFDCTVPEAHVGVALEAFRHGCHVLGEKPLADSMVNARRMVRAAAKAGRVHAVMQNRRYLSEIRAARKFIATGRVGTLTTLSSDFFIGAHFGGFRDQMQHVLLLDMAIHTFDAARLLCGADPVSVYCKEWNPAGSWFAHGASAVAVFTMSNGVVYTYRGSWCAEGLNTGWESAWHGMGTRGSFRWDGYRELKAQVLREQADEQAQKDGQSIFRAVVDVEIDPFVDSAGPVGHGGQLLDFVNCLRDGRTPETASGDNIKSLAMVFGAIESAEKGREAKVRY
jgi:predicted dehydrogenase